MNTKKTVQSSATPPSKLQGPPRRFHLQKLEERIAPKGAPFTKKCRPTW